MQVLTSNNDFNPGIEGFINLREPDQNNHLIAYLQCKFFKIKNQEPMRGIKQSCRRYTTY